MKKYRIGLFSAMVVIGVVSLGYIFNKAFLAQAGDGFPGLFHHLAVQEIDSPDPKSITQARLPVAGLKRFVAKQETLSALNITAQSALVVDFETKDILYEKNAQDRRQLASIVKLLTAMVVLDEYKLDDNRYLAMTQEAFDTYGGDSLKVAELFSVEDLLKAAIIVSSNDASQLLADNFGGRVEFINKMNKKAYQLGMYNSYFVNPHGLDEKPVSNYSTAADIMLLLQDLYYTHSEIMPILALPKHTIISKSGLQIPIQNTNSLLDQQVEMLGGKTGFTEEASETFACLVKIQGRVLGIVVLGSDIGGYRLQDTQSLIEWVQDNYSI